MNDLIEEIRVKSKQLDEAVERLPASGRCFAQSEQDYHIALARRILEERSKGTPVTISCRPREGCGLRPVRELYEFSF